MDLGLIFVLIIAAILISSGAGYVGSRTQALGPGTLGVSGDREAKTGEQVVTQAHGKYYEAVTGGNVYSTCFLPGTGLTPYTNSGALGTGASWALYNPKGSGKRIKIIKVSLGYVSGTMGAGSLYHCANTNVAAAAPTGTAVTPTNMDLGSANNAVGQPFYTATLPATPTALYPFVSFFAELATTAAAFQEIIEDVDGAIVLEQGTTWSLENSPLGAGSSPLVNVGIVWEEIPYV